MFDQIEAQADASQFKDWKKRASEALSGCEQAIAHKLSGGKGIPRLRLTPAKRGRNSLTLLLDVTTGLTVMKLFDEGHGEAAMAYHREKEGLLAFQGTGTVPPILLAVDKRRFLVTRFVEHLSLKKFVDKHGLEDACKEIGGWIARADRVSPANKAGGNWHEFLSRREDLYCRHTLDAHRDILTEIPLCGLVLSRSDSGLSNFLLSPLDETRACDFETAGFRPRGWDFVTAFEALVLQFPDKVDLILSALAQGFSKHHAGLLITEELCSLAKIAFCARANVNDPPKAGDSHAA